MNVTVEALLRDAIAATAVGAPSWLSWFGRRESPYAPAVTRALTRGQQLTALRGLLAARLYRNFYCTGRAVARAPRGTEADRPQTDREWVQRLSKANGSATSRDEGWTEVRRERGSVIVRKDGLTLAVPPRSLRRNHKRLSIDLPREYLKLSPGFYTADGEEPFGNGDVFRVYWNLAASGAPVFVRHGTTLLNRARIPFRLKVAAHPEAFVRRDAAVIYVPRRDRAVVFEVLRLLHRALRRHLDPGTPVFTKEIAPGVAVAEDPRGAESFGESRCRIVADALVDCSGRGLSIDARLRHVQSRFARHGIPLHRAYLNPGSIDVYPSLCPR